jgi:PhnB protein
MPVARVSHFEGRDASAPGVSGLLAAASGSSSASALGSGLSPGSRGVGLREARLTGMTGIQPELWIDRAAAAVAFYRAAFGARLLHQVGEGDEIVAQPAIGDAAFWVSPGGAGGPRFSPGAIGGATGRTLLLVDDPDAMFVQAVRAGATPASEIADEHGWRLGRIFDPFGHEWEIGKPPGRWPPA